MKDLFNKDAFQLSAYEPKQKCQSAIVSTLLILLFIVSSFTFLDMLYCFADIVGCIVSGSPDVAIAELLHSLPVFLVFFMSLWGLLLVHATFRRVNDEKWQKSLFKDAVCLIVFGSVNILYIIVMLIAGKYLSIVEGAPSPLYPLDTMLFSLVFIALGVLVILYLKKWKEDIPYLVPSRGNIVTKARGLYCTFVTFWMLFALFGFSAGIFSLFIYDFAHEFAFYGIATVLVYLLSPIQLAFWEFYYNELKEEKKKDALLPLAILSLAVSILFAVLYFVSLSGSLDAPSNAGFGMFPVAFAASVNIATLLTVATPIIVSVVALIKGLLLRKKAKAE